MMLVAFPPRWAGRLADAAVAGRRACEGCRARVAGAGARPARRRGLGVGVSGPECPVYVHMTGGGTVMIAKAFFLM